MVLHLHLNPHIYKRALWPWIAHLNPTGLWLKRYDLKTLAIIAMLFSQAELSEQFW